MMEFNI